MGDEHKTLIAVSDSVASENGFQFYVNRFHNPNSSVLLVHVVEPTIISSNRSVLGLPEEREKTANDEKRRIRELQDRYEDKMRLYGIRGRITIVYYSRSPGKVICRTAADEKCFLIVIGSNRKTTDSKQLGSVCKYVYRNAACPVAVIPSTDLDGGTRSPCSSCSRRNSSDMELPPPDYYTARRFSLAVPTMARQIRRVSEADILNLGGAVGSSCPNVSEIGEEFIDRRKSRSSRGPSTGQAPDLRLVTAQVHTTQF